MIVARICREMLSTICCWLEMFSLFWYFCIQWRCSPFFSCKASTFSRNLLDIFPVSTWPDLFESRKISAWTQLHSSHYVRNLQEDQTPLLDAINSLEQSNMSTIKLPTQVISSELEKRTVPRVKNNLTFHTSRKTMAKSGIRSKDRRLLSTTSLRALGSWSVGEIKSKLMFALLRKNIKETQLISTHSPVPSSKNMIQEEEWGNRK